MERTHAYGFREANTPMVITWPNSDGTITLSQRAASSNVMPTGGLSLPTYRNSVDETF